MFKTILWDPAGGLALMQCQPDGNEVEKAEGWGMSPLPREKKTIVTLKYIFTCIYSAKY